MADIEALVAELRAGLDKLPKGRWQTYGKDPAREIGATVTAAFCEKSGGFPILADIPPRTAVWTSDEMAAHIARCSPENISTLLDALEAERSKRVRLEEALSGACYIACLQKDDNSERAWFIVGWQGGRHSLPNNEEQAWLYRRGMLARNAIEPRDETEADRWCKHFTDGPSALSHSSSKGESRE